MIKRVQRIVLATLAMVAAPAAGQDACGAAWQTVNDTVAGATYEMAAPPRRSYFVSYGDNFPSTSNEQDFLDELGCASFSAAVWELGSNYVADTKGMFDQMQADAIKGGADNKLHWSRTRTVNGFPAREYLTSQTITSPLGGYSRQVYYRTLVVARGNQVLLFNSHWDGGDRSPIADRAFRSIQVQAGAANPQLRSYAMLSEAITKYWMFPAEGYTYTNYFTPDLLAIIDKTRERDAAAVKAFGYPRTFTYTGAVKGGKVVRVVHDDATVDWTLYDNGTVLTGIYYKRVDR